MDGLSAAASVIAVVDISAKVASLCFQYLEAVIEAKEDIRRLQYKINNIKNVLEELQRFLNGLDKSQLSVTRKMAGPLSECHQQLQKIKAQLEPSRGRKKMQRVGFQELRWPFTCKQVEKLVASLEQYEHTFSLALQVDQTELLLRLANQKYNVLSLPTAKGASFDSHMEERNSTCLHDTRDKLLHDTQRWAMDKNSKPIFWLRGAAGTGKSTIARTVARTFADQQQLGASFFFKKGERERGDAKRFFTTIATQLAVRVPEMRPEITKAIDADPDISEKALQNQFERLILQPLSEVGSLSTTVLIIVIDALDECAQDSDIRAILQLLSRTKDLKPVSLRIFVTSRPELHVRLGFRRIPDDTYELLVLEEVSKETIKHDIHIYLEYELTRIREERSLPLEWPEKRQIQALVNMAVPLFIFAATICRFVGELSGNPRRRLEDILKYETENVTKLSMTYLPILTPLFTTQERNEQIKLSREFQEVVGSIVVLESALSINALAHLLGRAKDDISCRLDSLHSVLSIPTQEDEPVRLLHLSFREFLVDISNRKTLFWVDERSRHEDLAFRCIEFMSSPNGLRQNMCDLKPGTLRSEIDERKVTDNLSPELQYACRYWAYHLKQSQRWVNDNDFTDLFLRKHFLHWLEAMSLIGDINDCAQMLKSLHTLVSSSDSAISLFLYDAQRFTLRFRHIIEHAPSQIYCSALVFAPEVSIVQKAFVKEIPKWLEGLSKRKDDWDACRSVLEGHTDWISAIDVSPNGQLAASASYDNTIRVWEVTTGSCCGVLEGHSSYISDVAFSPNSQLVASASGDKTLRIWEILTGLCHRVLKGHTDYASAITFSQDGQLVASASRDKTVRLWKIATGSCLNVLVGHTDWVRGITFLLDDQLVASVSDDKTVRLWEVTKEAGCSVLKGHTSYVRAVAFSRDNQLIASASRDATVRLWKAATRSCWRVLEGHTKWVRAVTFSPNSQLVASASDDMTVRVWDTATGSCCNVLMGHTDFVRGVNFFSESRLASVSDDHTVRVWDTMTESQYILEGHTGPVNAVAFLPDTQLLASVSDDKTLRLWETTTKYFSERSGHSAAVRAVTFSPDGCLVASASYDKTVRLWTATGRCYSVLEGHVDTVRAVAFSPDSKLLASASRDNTVRLWETGTGLCVSVLKGHIDYIRAVDFSPDGHYIQTDRGNIPLNPPTTPASSFTRKPPSEICVQNEWISLHNQRLLWLPSEFRPTCSTVDNNIVCLGHSSGAVTFIHLNVQNDQD